MKYWKKITLVLLITLIGLGVIGYLNRTSLMLAYIKNFTHPKVAANRPIKWAQGPKTVSLSSSERPPNIIFILADDLGINDISTFGGGVAGGRVPTPHIDRLAADGAIFSQAYAGNATCAPSRAMLMTGRYPTRTGFEFTPTPPGMGRMVSAISGEMDSGLPPPEYNQAADNAVPYEGMGLPGSEITIAELLKEQGYHTAHIGKWHLGRNAEMNPLAQGFDESLLMASGLFLEEGDPDGVEAKLDFDPIDKFLWAGMQYAASFHNDGFDDADRFKPGGYLTDWWTDESLKVIEANKNRPFFLYLAHWGVHTPLQATKADYEAVGNIKPHRLRVYAAMVRSLDRSVGRIMEKLEEEGLADNTIIVFSSDNGGAGYIGLPEVNAPYRGWKITLFEGGIRAPMFIKWPNRIKPGTRVDTPVAHIDVMPTLAAAGGATLPDSVVIDGKNMLPAATGTGTISRPNDAIFWQSGYYQVVRAGNWKLQVNGKQEKNWLFNLANDPTEQNNLAEKNPAKLAELKQLLADHHKGRKPPLYAYNLENPIAIDKTRAEKAEASDEYIFWPN
ncbi:sulfatase [Sphingorhabdus sp. EL138]|uniref:sulfatase n=1 Tax=Sphingorhabdus sp. EL138 TaxID=2073156 RepID=UPI000D68B170|nr:sulfatase [Sphingorhabdus sp. EL138]